jgi:c-di-GMP-related signal transduction protein
MGFTYVARQPIFDVSMGVVGYELLFRANAASTEADYEDASAATSNVLVSTFSDIPLESLLDDKPAYVNVTRDLLLRDIPNLLSPERIVIEIPEHEAADPDVRFALEEMNRQGYRIALDNWSPASASWGLIDLASTVKINVDTLSNGSVTSIVNAVHDTGALALATRIETHDELETCKAAGFDQFQGHFLSKPKIVEHRTLTQNSVELLRLLQALQDPDKSARDLADIIRRDIGLSVRILRVANSAFFALPRRVESITEAVMMLGTRQIARWAVLFSVASASTKPPALTATGLARARMCELLAQHQRHQPTQAFFTVGLFSVLDALMDLPMQQVLNALPLSTDLNEALLNRKGPLGDTLSVVCAYEVGDWAHIDKVEIDQRIVRKAFIDACAWADAATSQMCA